MNSALVATAGSNEATPIHGSNPCRTAIFAEDFNDSSTSRTVTAQNVGSSDNTRVRFPKTVTFRKAEAKIYGKTPAYQFYRATGYTGGKRRITSHLTYSEALKAAEKLVREIAEADPSSSLTPSQASDALVALERLESFFKISGQRMSLVRAVSEFTEASARLGAVSLTEAVEGYLRTTGSVSRTRLSQAIEEFIELRAGKTLISKDGRRPQLSPEHHYQTSIWLREFAGTFTGLDVCDITKIHVNEYMAQFSKLSPKTRNERRGILKMFLRWAVERDFLPSTHRLLQAGELKHELADPEVIELFSPGELRRLLTNADKRLLPVLALAGLAGIRLKEILRLTWENVFKIPDHVEISAFKSKTRSRRLVLICSALKKWLEPYRKSTGLVWDKSYDMVHIDFAELRHKLKIPDRRNGLRHAFVSAHYAVHSNEGLTAAQAGNSPGMVHKNYKGLLTKAQGEEWFSVTPK